jgi:peptide deformylase
MMSTRSPRILTLADYDQSVLRQKTQAITFPLSEADRALIQDMKFSIQPQQLAAVDAPWENAAGMAANQWGVNKSIFLFCPEGDTVDGLEVIINPSYTPLGSSQEMGWESCFSVPCAVGKVKRYTHIRVTYQNEEGETITKELTGYFARVWQHETDHLNGLLYDALGTEKCVEKNSFSSKEEVEAFYETLRAEKD